MEKNNFTVGQKEEERKEEEQAPAISFDLQEIAGNCKGNNAGGPLTHQEVVSSCERYSRSLSPSFLPADGHFLCKSAAATQLSRA